MSSILFEKVCRDFTRGGERFQALVDVDLEVREREFVAIVGPSGCGKTTLLRMVAGLEFCASRAPKGSSISSTPWTRACC